MLFENDHVFYQMDFKLLFLFVLDLVFGEKEAAMYLDFIL